jgi:ferritin-like metal-binding protein YciE
MTDEQQKNYLAWLRDAHAMELALATTLEKQIKDMEGKPAMVKRLTEHLEETKGHAEKVEACIQRNGGDVSGTKDIAGKMSAMMNGMTMNMTQDLLVKDIHSAYAAENFEIASYIVLRSAAEKLEDKETIAVCEDILEDEYKMADWVEGQIPTVVKMYLETL